MPIYRYAAKDNQGKTQLGEVEAQSESTAAKLLRDEGFFVISLKPKRGGLALGSLIPFLGKVSLGDIVNFTTQLATMMSAGLPLAQALGLLSAQSRNEKIREVIDKVLKDVEGGLALSKSFAKHPEVFPETYVSLVRAGEASGNLDTVLNKLAHSLEKKRDFQSRTKGALIYPVIVLFAMLGVLVIIVVFVIPKLSDMYASLEIELPLPTRVLMAVSSFVINFWWLMILLGIGGAFGLRLYLQTPGGKRVFSRLILKVPLMGLISRESELTNFAMTLGMLTGAGVPIVEGLEIVASSVSNILYQEAITAAAVDVERGLPLSTPLGKGDLFPPIVGQMIAVGEETGKMGEILDKLAGYFETEVDRKVKNLSTALEPIIIVGLGLMVGVLIISVITPIYKMTSSF